MKPERRRTQRIAPEQPIQGLLSKQAVRIVDLSAGGARIEHASPIAGRKVVELRFPFEGETLVVSCELVRSRLQRGRDGEAVYCSGIRFLDSSAAEISQMRLLVESQLHALNPTLQIAV
jgi:hypothetical protein